MIEERSIYHNVDTINTFPTKKIFVNRVLGLGFMGNQTRLVLIFFFPRNPNLITTIYLLFIMISLKL